MKYRTPSVTAGVVLVHAGLIWLLAERLSTPEWASPGEQVILASVVADMPAPALRPPMPSAAAPTPAQVTKPLPTSAPVRPEPAPTVPSTTPSPAAQATAVPQTVPPMPASSASGAASTGSALASPAAVVLPVSDADYLHNPPPAYPRMSRRLGEQGTVLLRVFISAEGRAEKADIRTSSGYARLDEAALETVQRWRYVPGKRAGQPEAMWFNVPINFVLE